MTAEIAVFNKSAVALAADSAVTISGGDGVSKIYNGADKLFALSRHHPVGIMVLWYLVALIYAASLGR
ncbi:hypothetical protein [Serratia marcescens]|uniref:hypothetical protein n=1 Tax=Serratia marcescens TaxID=615 RepID=UPI001E45DDA2|nr:hypothetical protein [Serratia marcescens]